MKAKRTWAHRVAREPLTHFCVIGLCLFAVDASLNPQGAEQSRKQIHVSENRIQHLASTYQTTFGRPPDEQELSALVDDFIIEEIAVREATAMGLDQDDKIVRRRMRQKFLFTLEDMDGLKPPTDVALKNWFDAHQSKYQVPATISFEHALWSSDRHGIAAENLATEALAQLKLQPDWHPNNDSGLFPSHYTRATQAEIKSTLGADVVNSLFAAETSNWFGPIHSVYGQHLFRVTEKRPSQPANFAEVKALVASDWMASQREELRTQSLAKLKAYYQIDVAWPDNTLPQRAAASPNIETPSTP